MIVRIKIDLGLNLDNHDLHDYHNTSDRSIIRYLKEVLILNLCL
jgi:hypothetical protein